MSKESVLGVIGSREEPLDLGYEVRRILSRYREQAGVTVAGSVRDLMTELVHLCDENLIEAQPVFASAMEVACEQTRKIQTPMRFDHHNEPY